MTLTYNIMTEEGEMGGELIKAAQPASNSVEALLRQQLRQLQAAQAADQEAQR
jgi:hypothetical protein